MTNLKLFILIFVIAPTAIFSVAIVIGKVLKRVSQYYPENKNDV